MASDFGHRPHPRLLLVTTVEVPKLDEIREIFATVDVVDHAGQVRHKDYDCALLWGEPDDIEEGLDVLQVSDHKSGPIRAADSDSFFLTPRRESLGRGLNYAQDLPADLKSLVATSLWPALENVPERNVWAVLGKSFGSSGKAAALELVHPIAADDDGRPLAAWFERRDEDREWWTLPPEVNDPLNWLRYLLGRWRERRPDRYPELGASFDDPAWQTYEEREASGHLVALESEREGWLAAWSLREQAARAELATATEAATLGPRRLLTEQSNELVDAVNKALTVLGFDVEDRDESPGKNGPREDLLVKDPAEPGWVAIVEVKGYRRGAKAGDFGQLLRHMRGYVDEHGTNPSRAWYVVNAFRESAPGSRPVALESHGDELQNYGEAGCLLIDTRDLFVASRGVLDGTVDADATRAAMREATGRLDLK